MRSCCWRRCSSWPPTTGLRARRVRRGAHRAAQVRARRREQLDRLIREDPDSRLRLQGLYATTCVGWASTNAPSRSTGSCCRERRRMRTCTCRSRTRRRPSGAAEEAIESYRQAAALPAGLRRCLLEPREPQDLPLHGCGARAPARARRRIPTTPPVDRVSPAASRSARPSRIRATTRSRFATTSRATR